MKFIENIDEEQYTNFVKNHLKSHFLQSYEWGQFCKIGKNQIPHYVGLIDDNNKLIATALLLQKKLLFGFSYFYSPRGYVLDFDDKAVLKKMTIEIKNYLRKNKAVFLTIDPDIKYHDVNQNAQVIENGFNNYKLFDCMLKLGYKHKGFNKHYEGNQPRYTFRIDFKKDFSEIENGFSKSFLKNVKKSDDYNVEVKIGESKDVEIFYDLISKTATRDDFEQYSKSYYQNFYDIFSKNNNSKIFIGKIYPQEIIKKHSLKIEEIEKEVSDTIKESKKKILIKTKERIERELEVFKQINSEEINVSGHIIVIYGNKSWALYAGTDNRYKDTFINNRVYYEKIKYAYENKAIFMDLFGVTGEPDTHYKNLAGIFQFKKQFGGECTEFIGEFDLITNKFLYKVLPISLKIYRKIKKGFNKFKKNKI